MVDTVDKTYTMDYDAIRNYYLQVFSLFEDSVAISEIEKIMVMLDYHGVAKYEVSKHVINDLLDEGIVIQGDDTYSILDEYRVEIECVDDEIEEEA